MLGEPDPFLVIEAGAGNGRLAREVLRGRARVPARAALRPRRAVAGAAGRAARAARARTGRRGAGPVRPARGRRRAGRARALGRTRVHRARGAARAVGHRRRRARERAARQPAVRRRATTTASRWLEVRVGHREADESGAEGFEELLVPADNDLGYDVDRRVLVFPFPVASTTGSARASGCCDSASCSSSTTRRRSAGSVSGPGCAPTGRTRPEPGRSTHRASRTSPPTWSSEQLERRERRSRVVRTDRQAEWLGCLGIDELVDEGRRRWREAGAQRGDLEALAGRSRVSEAAALDRPGRPRRARGGAVRRGRRRVAASPVGEGD